MNILYFVLFFFFARAGVPCFRWTISRCVRSTCLPVAFFARFIGSMPPPPPTPVFERYPPHTPFVVVVAASFIRCLCVFITLQALSLDYSIRDCISPPPTPLFISPSPPPSACFPFIYLFARTQPLPPKMLSLFPVLDAFRNISRCCCCTALYSFPPFLSFFLFASRQSPSFTYLPRPPTHICITQQQSIFFYRSLRPDMCLLPFPSSFLFAFAFALSYASPSPHLPHSLAMSSCGAFWYLLVGVLVIPLLLLVGTASLIFYFHFFMRVTDAKWGRLDSFSSCYLSIAFLRGFESCVSLSFFLSIFFFFFLLSVCVIVAF